MKYITPKYKYLECLFILKNESTYPLESVKKAKAIVKDYRKKYPQQEPTPVTDEQRNELKAKYPNLY